MEIRVIETGEVLTVHSQDNDGFFVLKTTKRIILGMIVDSPYTFYYKSEVEVIENS